MYFTLLEYIDGQWTIQFGDWDKQVVGQELKDRVSCWPYPKKKNFCIITTDTDNQKEIERFVRIKNNPQLVKV